MNIRTKAVHTGVKIDKTFNSVITPIYPTSTFYFDDIGKNKGYDYTRSANPTRFALEANIASLEGGVNCSATATGMAAITAVMFFLKAGDHVITGDDIYGGTYRLFNAVLKNMGYEFSFINMRDLKAVQAALRKNTKMIWIETPSNPLLNIVDIEQVTAIARKAGALSVVDNTFMSPYFQKPFEFGADMVVHSTTKYINGHSDVVGGAIVYGRQELQERGRHLVNALGVSQSPFDAWLVLRGVKTLVPRMQAHQDNAIKIANFLEGHKNIKRVYYPGLKSHPQGQLIKKQMKGFGAMMAFELNTRKVALNKFFKKLKYFSLAESLGGVESLAETPWFMSHASMGVAGLKASGITKETVRVSVGIEDAGDLIADLDQALKG
ncbi:MAG: PLP-dependent transferase [Candidatus Omnitrophica bacterium]|nr:PLP-dependent transferase [Candidatus Omnitrophota bacterium]